MAGDSQDSLTSDSTVAPHLLGLIDDHHRSLYAYAYRLTGQTSDAEDLTQQVFLIAQQKLDQLRDPAKSRPWLFRILRNQFLKNRQRKQPVTEADLESDIVETLPCEVKDTEVDSELLQESLDQLPEEFRIVLLMFYFDELSYKEIASELDVPLGTVMSRIARAKSALRRKLGAIQSPLT